MRRPALPIAALIVLAWPVASALAAGSDPGSILQGLAGAKRPVGDVRVTGWVERDAAGGSGADLVVRVEPRGAAKLVAEPGVVVTPVARDGLAWRAATVESDLAGSHDGYYQAPIELRVPFAGRGGAAPVEANVEYAYCLVGYQCLFGEAKVSAAVPAGAGS